MSIIIALCAACSLWFCTGMRIAVTSELPQNYTAYLHHFGLVGRRMRESPGMRLLREQAFWQRHASARKQNTRADARWTAAANHLFDATDDELKRMMGYKPLARKTHKAFSFVNLHSQNESIPAGIVLQEAVDWRKHVRASNKVRYQGSCGSCWAIAAGSALEMHAELAGYSVPGLQVNQLVGCVPNTRHCGGGGGCDGATAELAFQYAAEHGVAFEDDLKWDTKGGLCQKAPKRIISQGFERLTPNLALPLQYALAMKGPVVVSADASDWELYGGGVFDDCPKNAAVNHAVLAVGYGVSTSGKYWLIRNSWGKEWGEAGHIRILRFEDGSDGYCGTDYHPQEGVACDGETSPVPVCGMCGILMDSSYPIGVKVSDGVSQLRGANTLH
ncbi:unnamed protein product [Effrenium voratum]|uniref:Peptidase C1A papain C-terminal domain-containing protein n=2 Tax=Effrenium voratum TaxID=2562239 RepID=A0AA36J1T0_9DINO|nr:unnamed protein product [Effrenium voratum]CAJ1397529.1 unnamed protein product [Effrenium voratum]